MVIHITGPQESINSSDINNSDQYQADPIIDAEWEPINSPNNVNHPEPRANTSQIEEPNSQQFEPTHQNTSNRRMWPLVGLVTGAATLVGMGYIGHSILNYFFGKEDKPSIESRESLDKLEDRLNEIPNPDEPGIFSKIYDSVTSPEPEIADTYKVGSRDITIYKKSVKGLKRMSVSVAEIPKGGIYTKSRTTWDYFYDPVDDVVTRAVREKRNSNFTREVQEFNAYDNNPVSKAILDKALDNYHKFSNCSNSKFLNEVRSQ